MNAPLAVAGIGVPRAAPETVTEAARRERFTAAHPDSVFCVWEGCWVGDVRIPVGDGRTECTAVRHTMTGVLDALEEFTSGLAAGP